MGIVGGYEEAAGSARCAPPYRRYAQSNRDARKILLGGRVLLSIVDLLPERKIVVSASVALERCSCHIVEHDVRDLPLSVHLLAARCARTVM